MSGFFGYLFRYFTFSLYKAFNLANLGSNLVLNFVACVLSIFIEYWVYREYKFFRRNKLIQTRENYSAIAILVGAIAIVSTIWTSYQLLWQADFKLLILVALAAAIAKILGGILADFWGWGRSLFVAVSIAALLFFIPSQNTALLLLSLALLQSTVPITLATIGKMMPKQPATGAGFALGLAIFIGAIPPALGSIIRVTLTGSIAGGLAIATLSLLLWLWRK